MTIEIIGLVTIFLGFLSAFIQLRYTICCFIFLTILGSAAALLLGGAGSIQPAHLFLGFLSLSIFSKMGIQQHVYSKLTFPGSGFWLILILAYGILSAIFFPRIFVGMSFINPIGSTSEGAAPNLVRLAPTSGNKTQTIYLIADCACFLVISNFINCEKNFRAVVYSLVVYCGSDVIFALADLITASTGTDFVFDVIRNADYALHSNEVTGGLRRIIGSFTETSAFSAATIGAFSFTFRLWLGGSKIRGLFVISLSLLILLLASTSATAYAALFPMLVYLYLGAVIRLFLEPVSVRDLALSVIGPLLGIVTVLYIFLNQEISRVLMDFLEAVLFSKSSSESGMERAQWNIQATQNFIDTYGLGGGLGTIRASSFFLAVLSNLGLFGAICFTLFFSSIIFESSDLFSNSNHARERNAARAACIGLIIASGVSGSLVDLGLVFYIFAALATSRVNKQITYGVEPGCGGGRKVDGSARMSVEPSANLTLSHQTGPR